MVVIYSNENNPAALKLIVAQNFAKAGAEIKIVSVHELCISRPRYLPYLEIDEEKCIFSTNSALKYLLPVSENSEKVNEWLEWETSILSPTLAYAVGSAQKNEIVKTTLIKALQKLHGHLEKKSYLIGESLTAADISIWSTLYPLYKCPNLSKDFLLVTPNINKWMVLLESISQFRDAIASFSINGGCASYQALLNGAKYFMPLSVSNNLIKEKESPQHQVETVSDEELAAAEISWKKNIKDLPMLHKPKQAVLPVAGEKNVLITSALPYVNNVPHLGNIIGCVLSADVFARFSRLCNHNTLYICGTDEYGTATETKALEEGLAPQAICDKYYKVHKEIYEWFNISFDCFGRTSTPEQTELCQEMFFYLNDNGFMFTQSVDQLHCEKCDRFLADRFVEGGCPNIGCNYEDARGDQCDGCGKLVNAVELKNPRCKMCSSMPKLKTSNQFFIDLPKLEPLLHHWIKLSSPGWSSNAQVIAKSWLKEGLKPRCITRDLKWGVPVPLDGFRDKVFYVWFDAPIGYLSISKAYSKDFQQWWMPKGTDVTLYQFMAKDNVPFHSVLFPAMLLGANKGYATVSHLMATEYLNYEDGKFSKSRGVGVFGTDARSTGIPSDVWRFYLLYIRPESQDSSFSWNDLVTKNNSELLNNLGNFVNRALVFAKNNFNRTVPQMKPNKDDYTLLALCTRELKAYVAALEKAKLRDGIRHILTISRHGNQYMQANQPWVLLKGNDEERLRAGTVIGICCNITCLLATLLQPYMPDTSMRIQSQLNCSDVVIIPSQLEIVTLLPAGHELGEPSPLFAKIEPARAEELKKQFAGTQDVRENRNSADLKIIEAEVAKQADKVRTLKSSGAGKAVWQPEVVILLDLKKKFEAAQKNGSAPKANEVNVDLKVIEVEVAKQADRVRILKSSGADKTIWQPEVAVLLDLKKKLEAAQKNDAAPKANKVNVDLREIEADIANQGLVVRKLKEGGAPKSAWQPEVEKLLCLKNQLAVASGTAPLTQKEKKKK